MCCIAPGPLSQKNGLAGSDEFATDTWKVKLLAEREERTVAAADLVAAIQSLLASDTSID